MVEAVCGAVSSIDQFTAVERLSRREQLTANETLVRQMITYDSSLSDNAGGNRHVNNLNNSLLNGARAAQVAVQTNDLDQIQANRDPEHNAHLAYADTQTHGYGIARIKPDQIDIELITLEDIRQDDAPTAKKRVAHLVIPYAAAGQTPSISEPVFEGAPPFPYAYE